VVTKLFTEKDIREIGSGNIGATNVLRSSNKKLGISTLFLDIIKGAIPTFIALQIMPDHAIIIACLALVGHIYPIWLNFKGGKGVATYLGIISVFNVFFLISFSIVWALVFLKWKYSSLASIVSVFTVSLLMISLEFLDKQINLIVVFSNDLSNSLIKNLIFILFMFVILIYRHRENIKRLLNNEENKI
tara:strand:- start:9368 stop:9934 length:567 start_codon:yes stop_codon:yes gene_type:complete